MASVSDDACLSAEAEALETLGAWWCIADELGPDVPCPVFDGHPVTWDSWDYAPVLSHAMGGCDDCDTAQVHITSALPVAVGPRTSKVIRLSAVYCPGCRRLAVLVYGWHPPGSLRAGPIEAPRVVCDGCDRPAAFGASVDEARANLALLAGASDPASDTDTCRACTPRHQGAPA
jgi:hypothetical protein